LDKNNFKIVSIVPILSSESDVFHLIAITDNAIRLYFTTNKFITTNTTNTINTMVPIYLELMHVRLPPRPNISNVNNNNNINNNNTPIGNPFIQQQKDYNNINYSYYNNGVMIVSDSKSEEIDNIHFIYSEFIKGKYQNIYLDEAIERIEINGKVWSIAEEPIKIENYPWSDFILSSKLKRNEIGIQHLIGNRKFLCLTNVGLHIFTKERPVDKLLKILLDSNGNDSIQLKSFFDKYGEDQFCFMCLFIASTSFDQNIINVATRIFFKFGGRPSITIYNNPSAKRIDNINNINNNNNNNNVTIQETDFGHAVHGIPDINYSYLHDAFYLYISRSLRTLWFYNFFKKNEERITFLYSKDQIKFIQNLLLGLKSFLERSILTYIILFLLVK
jgi:nuclear pore complex protein Nup155